MASPSTIQPNGQVANQTTDSQAIPATHLLATFISTATPNHLTPEIRAKVQEVLLDYIGVTLGAIHHADSTKPIYNAIKALQGPVLPAATTNGSTNSEGKNPYCTVLGHGTPHFLPQHAGLLNAAFAHSLDFDDTYAAGTLHAGITTISAALTQAESLANSGTPPSAERFILAVSVGYEVTCRLGRELGFEAYERGFHNTGTAGIFGAVATIAVLKGLSTEVVENAFGLAGSKAAGSMQYLENGSWNKRLHAGFAVHDAFLCVTLAEAGVLGAAKAIEGKNGFLKAYTPNPSISLSRLTADLGSQWCWLASALKPYPACRMTHCFIEICGEINADRAEKGAPMLLESIASITARMTPANHILIGDDTPNKRHPSNAIDAQFSVYFQVANALLYGARTGDMTPYSRLDDAAIHRLTDKVQVQVDESMSGFAAKMQIRWSDGSTEDFQQVPPLGEVQHPFSKDKVEEKFRSLAEPVLGKERAEEVVKRVCRLEEQNIADLIQLLG
ncbi:2-methylcitrate dehydratase PrpD [Teratosphaeria nubilosa]|uniref:2-methylcitrate dehydratase PrpD n=1 Tax=Teratosphaeria nubilosa TaxID=161662 RepID=A0A6G1KYT3_9PEZI|nr:2-methylcitrate dehydratase PrpD [Teratosphaeria nubilosa]